MTSYRIAKYISRCGYCSRRQAEALIFQQRVTCDGHIVATPAFIVDDTAVIKIDQKTLKPMQQTRIWRYHKPRGLIVTQQDEKGRKTIFDQLKQEHQLGYVMTIGRLDLDSEGLLLLTNNGDIARHATLPQNQWIRKYKVRAYGYMNIQKMQTALKKGIVIDNIAYGSIDISLDKHSELDNHDKNQGNRWFTVALREGKNREIRHIFDHFNLRVNRLIRLSFGAFHLGKLKKGDIDEISPKAVASLFGQQYQ